MEDVSYEKFEKKCECANASKFWEFRDGTVVIIELPKRDHEVAHCEFTRQFIHQVPGLQFNVLDQQVLYILFTYGLWIYIIY